MCRCNPLVKTPWCGKPGCTAPPQPKRKIVKVVSLNHDETARLKWRLADGTFFDQEIVCPAFVEVPCVEKKTE